MSAFDDFGENSMSDIDERRVSAFRDINEHRVSDIDDMSGTKLKGNKPMWGREKDISNFNAIVSTFIFLLSPLVVFYFWHTLEHYEGSLLAPFTALLETGYSYKSGWLLFHVLAYLWFPSNIGYGQETPAGYVISYRTNGFRIWVFTHVLYLLLSVGLDLFDPAIIQKNWGGLLIATNLYGYLLTFFSYAKAHYAPSHPEDCKFSGCVIYDIFMGVELNPRLGDLDFKLFHNGRPGITAWTLINLSFLFAQYQRYGYVTNSMIILNFLHAIYVVDFFYYEDWYLRTIDIAHDHFGFYLAWGDSVWLPFMYTLQAQYLYLNPIDLSPLFSALVLTLGLAGYYIFRQVNNQKDLVRKKKGDVNIWGQPARVIKAQYLTSDGVCHTSLLLTSGFWGLSRHFNYVGDLMMCLAFCLTCGLDSLLPHFYFPYMVVLLIHRVRRDHSRCLGKYGAYWEKYCELVPYKVIPFIY
ncbi:hypothetical protein L0F63_003194 [Massospora cicadina]|nr:hypothetical protein L0F63_003194 [Massospora cicadina]